MDREGFGQLLLERQVPEDQIEQQIALAERFEEFAGEPQTAGDVRAFSTILVEEELNTWDNFVTLARYGSFTQNDGVYVAVLELIDGAEALDGLYEKLGQAVMERLERLVDPETCRQILSGSLRHLEDAWYVDEREKYAEHGSVDAYLVRRGQDLVAELEKLRDEGDVSVSPTFCQCSAGFHKKSWEVIFEQPLQAEVVETVLKGDPWCKIAIHLPEEAVAGANP
jgi:DNA-binding HxlR family transcriptional regulator